MDDAKARDGLLRLGIDDSAGDRKRGIQGDHVLRFLRDQRQIDGC